MADSKTRKARSAAKVVSDFADAKLAEKDREIERLRAALTEIAREERLGPYTTAIIHCSSARDVARAALGGLPWTAK